jgi:rhodanese-related sulfurtransferase
MMCARWVEPVPAQQVQVIERGCRGEPAGPTRFPKLDRDPEFIVRFPNLANSSPFSWKALRSAVVSACLAGASVALTGCNTNIVDRDVTWAESTSEALEVMGKPRGAFGISGSPRAVWVDPRGETEYRKERIPGAVNLPFARIELEHMVAFKDKDVLMVYDSDSDSALATTYAKRLLALGYKDVYCLRGGLKAWKRDGHTTDKG